MAKKIVLLGTFDTKGREFKYIKEIIEQKGHRTIAIDTGILRKPAFPPDIPSEDVARRGGSSLEERPGLQ